jgi:hypothetical protein
MVDSDERCGTGEDVKMGVVAMAVEEAVAPMNRRDTSWDAGVFQNTMGRGRSVILQGAYDDWRRLATGREHRVLMVLRERMGEGSRIGASGDGGMRVYELGRCLGGCAVRRVLGWRYEVRRCEEGEWDMGDYAALGAGEIVFRV